MTQWLIEFAYTDIFSLTRVVHFFLLPHMVSAFSHTCLSSYLVFHLSSLAFHLIMTLSQVSPLCQVMFFHHSLQLGQSLVFSYWNSNVDLLSSPSSLVRSSSISSFQFVDPPEVPPLVPPPFYVVPPPVQVYSRKRRQHQMSHPCSRGSCTASAPLPHMCSKPNSVVWFYFCCSICT